MEILRSSAKVLILAIIRLYQLLISGLLGSCCRFEPSCSSYAMEAIQSHGCIKGSGLGLRRVLRCHPWQPGGYDPVPKARVPQR